MITIRLNYPYRQDIQSYQLPLPETYEISDVCILLFSNPGEYYHYLDRLCDLVDELEFTRLGAYTRQKACKLEFCKRYIAILAGASLAVC
jgi:hypothetical protein